MRLVVDPTVGGCSQCDSVRMLRELVVVVKQGVIGSMLNEGCRVRLVRV